MFYVVAALKIDWYCSRELSMSIFLSQYMTKLFCNLQEHANFKMIELYFPLFLTFTALTLIYDGLASVLEVLRGKQYV